jgi:segregation and condensation protein B
MSYPDLSALLEAIIYLAEEPVEIAAICKALPEVSRHDVEECVRGLIAKYQTPEHGIEVREVAGGLRFSTKPEHHDILKKFIQSLTPPTRLSLAALETLAVIAYKQPATIPEVQEIRGVQASGVIKTLLDKKLITAAGRKEVLGRPILYKTTKEFLIHFGLNSLDELPSMEEFEELIKNQAATEDVQTELPLEEVP